ncbi:MAG: PUA domain-containing protein [Candidatus Bathyarchaeota archaeon]
MKEDVERLRAVADFQFGRGAGEALFPEDTVIEYSKNTGKPRHLEAGGVLVANYRPNDALFTLTIAGARRLAEAMEGFGYAVTILDDVVEAVEEGRNVFAKHVVDAGDAIRPGDEVVVLDSQKEVIAVGKALLIKKEMLSFRTGAAVKVRRGRSRHR